MPSELIGICWKNMELNIFQYMDLLAILNNLFKNFDFFENLIFFFNFNFFELFSLKKLPFLDFSGVLNFLENFKKCLGLSQFQQKWPEMVKMQIFKNNFEISSFVIDSKWLKRFFEQKQLDFEKVSRWNFPTLSQFLTETAINHQKWKKILICPWFTCIMIYV